MLVKASWCRQPGREANRVLGEAGISDNRAEVIAPRGALCWQLLVELVSTALLAKPCLGHCLPVKPWCLKKCKGHLQKWSAAHMACTELFCAGRCVCTWEPLLTHSCGEVSHYMPNEVLSHHRNLGKPFIAKTIIPFKRDLRCCTDTAQGTWHIHLRSGMDRFHAYASNYLMQTKKTLKTILSQYQQR